MYFSPFANQAEVWPRFQSLLKLLLWTKGVDIESKYPMPWVRCAFGNVCIFLHHGTQSCKFHLAFCKFVILSFLQQFSSILGIFFTTKTWHWPSSVTKNNWKKDHWQNKNKIRPNSKSGQVMSSGVSSIPENWNLFLFCNVEKRPVCFLSLITHHFSMMNHHQSCGHYEFPL